MKKTAVFIISASLVIMTSCSTVSRTYIEKGYIENNNMIKKVIVAVETPENNPESAPLIANIAADIIKLKTNYLVYNYKAAKNRDSLAGCAKEIEGIFYFSINKSAIKNNKLQLEITGELYRCSNGGPVWKASASKTAESDNPDLKELTHQYEKKYKGTASVFAAPAFIVITDIVNSSPDPELTENEIDLKINLDAKK